MGRNALFVAEAVMLTPRACYWIAPTLAELARTYDGTDVGAALDEVVAAVDRARDAYVANRGISDDGSTEAVPSEVVPASPHDELDAADVAGMLNVTQRRVGQIAEELGGRKVAGRWRFDRAAVEFWIDTKEAS
ncbi:hypothetical protein DVS28_a4815 [Euzebya pacifica]|uniref:Helix-turn-helix domain-containing protein n=1 Tax=Euzebya pacifica TaxID=1608957 RepID=A0A346Y4S6_9ACTN|nr:hypothetical protein [Euzebya pacifica]AXV09473.1 hypothetical protein DVS28_a4815 [Euzebya pacifica]